MFTLLVGEYVIIYTYNCGNYQNTKSIQIVLLFALKGIQFNVK